MKNIISLFSVLTKNTEMKVPKKGGKGTIYRSIGILALTCIMVPCCAIVGFISYTMTLALIEAGAPANGIMAEIHIMSAFSLVFGMLVIFNILFFSSDREHLVPLPFKSHELLLAKFMYAYLAESVMEFLILISMFIGYGIADGFSLVKVLAGVLGVVLIPLVPLAYCAIIGLLLFVFLKGIKNGRIFGHVSTVILIMFVALFLYSFKGMGSINVDNYVESLASGNNLFSNVVSKIFFATPFLLKALEGTEGIGYSLLMLLIYILLNLAVVAVMAVIGKYTYYESLMVVGALGSSGKKSEGAGKNNRPKSIFSAYLGKELKVLLRTRAYSGNCVFINFLWPLLVLIICYANRKSAGFESLKYFFNSKYDSAYVLYTISVILLAFIASAMNSLASTAFTREGLHLDIVKYIPVPYETQAFVKGLISVVITLPGLLLSVFLFNILFDINMIWLVYHGIIMIMVVVITTILGMYLDSLHPHVTWDDEYSALRGNLNTFFDMALVMVIAGIVCSLGFVCYNLGLVSSVSFHVLMMAVILILMTIAVLIGKKKIVLNMASF